MSFSSCRKNDSIRKINLISKSMTSQPGEQTIAIHIMSNISRNFGQLLEYNMRNIFVEKSYTKCAGEFTPRLLSKKSKLSISLDQLFLLYATLRAIEI